MAAVAVLFKKGADFGGEVNRPVGGCRKNVEVLRSGGSKRARDKKDP